MVDFLNVILDSIKGQQVSAVFAFVVIVAILVICGYFITKFMQSFLKNPDFINIKVKKNSQDWIKSEEGSKFLVDFVITQIKLNDDRIVEKISKKIESDIQLKIFEETKILYEKISKMREEYAGNYVTRKELDIFVEELDAVRIDLARLKGHLNLD